MKSKNNELDSSKMKSNKPNGDKQNPNRNS